MGTSNEFQQEGGALKGLLAGEFTVPAQVQG